MNNMAPNFHSRQRGMGIVEVMVGILIGMIVVVAIYNVFAVAEGYKRTAVGAADAQTTGLFAQFVLAREISNAGNALSGDSNELKSCLNVDPKWPMPAAPSLAFGAAGAKPIRPIPVLIRDSGSNDQSDSLIVTYSTAPWVVSPVIFVDPPMVAAGDPFYVQSPNGFGPVLPTAVRFRVIAYDNAGNCELVTVTSASVPDPFGIVKLTYTPNTTALYTPSGAQGSKVLNLGRDTEAVRTLFDVTPLPAGPCTPAKGCQLRTTDLFSGANANPIAQNVVLLKAQYGIDCLGNGVVTWTSATGSGVCGNNFTPDDLINPIVFDGPGLARIRAIRIGIVVRSDEPDLKDPALVGQSAVLFNCSVNTNAACQGRVALTNAVLANGYRHRIYETIVPMRNAIYNNGT
jgi:type IV pilus assembly protein PilW